MQKQNQIPQRPLAIGLTILSALGRLVPHAPNVTPLGGSCLFAGSRIRGMWAYLLPLFVMAATDALPVLPYGGGFTWASPVIYGSFLLNVWIGRRMLRRVSPSRIGAAALICSLQFFVLTNLAVWIATVVRHDPMYSADLAGLIKCYTLALPFWGRTLAGDLLFSAGLFGIYELLTRKAAQPDPHGVTA